MINLISRIMIFFQNSGEHESTEIHGNCVADFNNFIL